MLRRNSVELADETKATGAVKKANGLSDGSPRSSRTETAPSTASRSELLDGFATTETWINIVNCRSASHERFRVRYTSTTNVEFRDSESRTISYAAALSSWSVNKSRADSTSTHPWANIRTRSISVKNRLVVLAQQAIGVSMIAATIPAIAAALLTAT